MDVPTKWEDLNRDQLVLVAESYGVDGLTPRIGKAKIIGLLDAEGVSFDSFLGSLAKDGGGEAEPVQAEPTTPKIGDDAVLLKMTRPNPTYEVGSYRFTQEHPFVLVDPASADWILENTPGFAIASPKEVKAYYG